MLVLTESELSTMMTSSESSVVPVSSHCGGPLNMNPGICSEYPHSPSASTPAQMHSQASCTPLSPRGSYQNHQWDINDSTLPVSDVHDPFELWPSGHYRRVYRGDSDDARRHVSGWAMRNTNNHNALILKKSCLGVLVCSLDCLLESGRKVHFRPAICDKARRKQIGKPCPNPGCQGKLTLLSCRGHCGYPVTHFWRHVNNSVFFQAKGYHDHPRPEVKSLSDKGRHAFSKQLHQDGERLQTMPNKRRFPISGHDDGPERKIYIPSEDEVMCSCPPFECVCPKSSPHKSSFMSSAFGFIKDSPSHTFLPHRSTPGMGLGMEQVAHGPFTQINITNTCLPQSALDVSIPSIEIYKNCPKFGSHGYYHDDMKIFRHGNNDNMTNPLSHLQHVARCPVDEVRSPQILNCPPSVGFQHSNCGPRNFIGSAGMCHTPSMCSHDVRDDYNRYRVNPMDCFNKGRGVQQEMDDRAQSMGLPLKTEPNDAVFRDIPPSPHGEQNRNFQNDSMYSSISPSFNTDHILSPRIVDCQAKYERSPEGVPKGHDQSDGQQELTYITLTSPPRQQDNRQNHREFHSCRLGHVVRSPTNTVSSSLENVSFQSLPPQPSRVDTNGTDQSPLSTISPRHQDSRDVALTPSSSAPPRRSSPAMPRLVLSDDSLNQQGVANRNTNLYPPFNSYQDQPSGPFSLTSDSHMAPYPPRDSAFGNSSLVPYGFYCNDMFANAREQAYRNRSINITLTYN